MKPDKRTRQEVVKGYGRRGGQASVRDSATRSQPEATVCLKNAEVYAREARRKILVSVVSVSKGWKIWVSWKNVPFSSQQFQFSQLNYS